MNKRKDGNNSSKSQESGAMNAKAKQLTCYGCSKSGHIKSKCKFRKKNSNKFGKADSKTNDSANEASNQSKQLTMCAYTYIDKEMNACSNACDLIYLNTDVQANSAQRSEYMSRIKFVLYSGATQHMVNDKRYFVELEDIDNVNISVAKKNESITAKQQGDISVKTFYGNDTSPKTMKNVLFVKDLKCNLYNINSQFN